MKTLNTTHKQTSIASYLVSAAQPSQVLREEGGSIDIGDKLNMKQENRDIPDAQETSTPSNGSSKRLTKESSQENLRKLTFDRGEAK